MFFVATFLEHFQDVLFYIILVEVAIQLFKAVDNFVKLLNLHNKAFLNILGTYHLIESIN
jgi:hypothetical protein